jgi:hypothetical protein
VPSLAIIKAYCLAKHSLMVAIAYSQNECSLPEKDFIVPNQKTWKETADQMGVQKTQKKKQLPEECRITDHSIGIAKGKHHHEYDDPYAGSKQSGKCAKPDAVSADANVHACASTS